MTDDAGDQQPVAKSAVSEELDEAPPERRSLRWRPLALLFAGQLAGGVVIGLIWLAWAPRTTASVLQLGGQIAVVPAESESQMAGDGRFIVLSMALGLLVGVIAWLIRSVRGPLTVLALAGGAVLSSLAAREVGRLFSSGSDSGPVNTVIKPTLTTHGLPLLWVQAFVAVLAYLALAGLTSDPALGRDRRLR